MTIFERKSYYRTSKNGIPNQVNQATVDRNVWNRRSLGQAPTQRSYFLERYPEFNRAGSFAASFVNPNATCPVCGASVFYYQNSHGSRVFFDDLGPLWPKHRCTDRQLNASTIQSSTGLVVRTQAARSEIARWQKHRGIDCFEEFTQKHGTRPWPLATIVKRIKGGKAVFLFLKVLTQAGVRNSYLSCKAMPKCCKEGSIIAVSRRKISVLDTSTWAAVEIAIKRHRGASAFLNAMIEQDAK